MALFMDLHISASGDIPIDELIEKHKADLACQQKYGVKFKSFWVNQEKGMVFCLMEGPDKQSCMNVHQQAHGDTGCNIIEVNPGDFDKFLAGSMPNAYDIAESREGIMDNAYRTILRYEVINPVHHRHDDQSKIEQIIKKNQGNLLFEPHHSIRAIFIYPMAAHESARQIADFADKENIDYRMNIVSGKPVDQNHKEFFGYVKDLGEKMVISGKSGRIKTNQLFMDLIERETYGKKDNAPDIDVLSIQDEEFLVSIMDGIKKNFQDPSFNTHRLAADTFLSRSQLFKKTKTLTGFTPNTLIREFRFYQAIKLLRKNPDHIAQLAFDSGFNSPSYFSKVFTQRFGLLPSEMINRLKV